MQIGYSLGILPNVRFIHTYHRDRGKCSYSEYIDTSDAKATAVIVFSYSHNQQLCPFNATTSCGIVTAAALFICSVADLPQAQKWCGESLR